MKPLKKNVLQDHDEPLSPILPPQEDNPPINYDELDPDLAAELMEQELKRKHAQKNPNAKPHKNAPENEHQVSSGANNGGLKKNPSKKKTGTKGIPSEGHKEEIFYITPQDMMRLDRNQRTILHRAALDQNTDLLRTLCKIAEDDVGNFVVDFINKPDKFGNTALLVACILNNDKSPKERPECIKLLLKARAEVNIRSGLTLWTPLTWCAYYGDFQSVKVLLEYQAFAYLPDSKGLYPLDYCGMQVNFFIVEGIGK